MMHSPRSHADVIINHDSCPGFFLFVCFLTPGVCSVRPVPTSLPELDHHRTEAKEISWCVHYTGVLNCHFIKRPRRTASDPRRASKGLYSVWWRLFTRQEASIYTFFFVDLSTQRDTLGGMVFCGEDTWKTLSTTANESGKNLKYLLQLNEIPELRSCRNGFFDGDGD